MKILSKYACAAILCIMASCGRKNDYRNALPEQAAAVASIDLPRLSTRASFDGKYNSPGLQRMKEILKSGLEGSGQLVDRIFADVSESGIDFSEKIYLFASEENAYMGLLAKVTSSSRLEDVIHSLTKEQLCQPVRDTDGCNWTILGKWLLAYSDDALLVLADNKWSDPSKLVRQASMWLRQEEGQGFVAKSDFQQLQSVQSDIACWLSLQLLPRKFITPLTMGLSASLDLKKTKAIVTLDFEKGRTIINVDPLITDDIVGKLVEKKIQSTGAIEGKYLDVFPSKTTFWMTANLKGKAFYQFLREIPATRKFFDYSNLPITLDFGRIIEAIDGEVSFAITDPMREEYILYADVNQTDFLKVFTDLRPILAKTNEMLFFESQVKDAYGLSVRNGSLINLRPGRKDFWFGVTNGRFYLTNNGKLVSQRVLGLSLRDMKWGTDVPGKRFFAVSSWNGMKAFETLMQKNVLTSVPKPISGLMDYLTIESVDGKHIHCVIEHKNSKQNLVQLLLNLPF